MDLPRVDRSRPPLIGLPLHRQERLIVVVAAAVAVPVPIVVAVCGVCFGGVNVDVVYTCS